MWSRTWPCSPTPPWAPPGGEVAKKVQEAVKFCKEKAPELAIDGDLQLDAAIVPTVAQLKAPGLLRRR